MDPNKIQTKYNRMLYCETCKDITEHLIALHSATDKGVTFFKSCNMCYSKIGDDEECEWEIERIPVKDWNSLILIPLY